MGVAVWSVGKDLRSAAPGVAAGGAALGFSVWAWGRLPERVATHWNLAGRPDGYSSKIVAAVVFPLAILGVTLLLGIVLPRIDPRRRSHAIHRATWWVIWNVVMVFLAILHVVVIGKSAYAWSVGIPTVASVGAGVLFIAIGNYLPRVRPNWWLGIRTPWTLSSDAVWRRTHRLGAWIFIMAGVITLAGALFDAAWLVLPAALGAGLVSVAYSYVLWKREQPPGEPTAR